MINVFLNKEIMNKLEKLPKEENKKLFGILKNIQENKLFGIKKIPSSKLYVKKVSNHVLIMAKREKDFFLIDILTKTRFDEEYKKSILLFL